MHAFLPLSDLACVWTQALLGWEQAGVGREWQASWVTGKGARCKSHLASTEKLEEKCPLPGAVVMPNRGIL